MLRLLPKHPYFQEFRDTLRFLLDHPRRCYTNLFPSLHTWWLLCAVVVLNGVDWVMFEVLNVSPECPRPEQSIILNRRD
jgi:Trk-type K+ transport system membrane component